MIWYQRLNPNIEEPTTYLIHGGARDGQVISEAEYHAIENKAGTGIVTGFSPVNGGTAWYAGYFLKGDGDPLS